MRRRRPGAIAATLFTLVANALLIAACDERVNAVVPDVTLELIENEPGGRCLSGCVRVTNRGDHTAWFSGYDADTPIFCFQQLVDGEWRYRPVGVCGTDLEARPLAAGSSIEWKWRGWVEQRVLTRTGVEFSSMRDRDDSRGAVMVAWSEPFQPGAPPLREH